MQQYNIYTDAGKFENPKKLFGKDITFALTTKYFIAKWNGTIKAGIKIDEINVRIDSDNKEIIINIPYAEILSHTIEKIALKRWMKRMACSIE